MEIVGLGNVARRGPAARCARLDAAPTQRSLQRRPRHALGLGCRCDGVAAGLVAGDGALYGC